MNYAAIGAQAAPGSGAPVPLALPWTAGAVKGFDARGGCSQQSRSLAGSAARHTLVTAFPSFVRTLHGQQESPDDEGWERPLRSSPTMMLLHLIPTPESPGSQSRAHISIPASQPGLRAALYALKGLAEARRVSWAASASQEREGTELPFPQPPHREPSSARNRPSSA